MLWQIVLGTFALLKGSPTIQETENWGPLTPEDQDIATRALQGDKYGGDMILHNDFPLGNGIKNDAFRWPGYPGKGIIPYVIDKSLEDLESLILRAMEQYNKTTCIKFVPKKEKDTDFVRLYKGVGCHSNVGKWGGMQNLSLGEGCQYIGSIVHELGHAVGLYHEHQRSDRDNHIVVYGENIRQGLKVNFQKTKVTAELLYDKFNFNSIMIYGNYAFSKDNKTLKTMEVIGGSPPLTEPWAKPGLTNSDMDRVNCLYQCGKKICPSYRPS